MTTFIIISTVFNMLWAICWSSKDLKNCLVKVAYICMTVFGACLLYKPAGVTSHIIY